MGALELSLILKYGVPLAIKLLLGGKIESETVDAVNSVITGMASGDIDVAKVLLAADEEQTNAIINGTYNVIIGTADALGDLVKSLSVLFANEN